MKGSIVRIIGALTAAGLLAGCSGIFGSGKTENEVQVSLSEAVRKGDLKQVKDCVEHGWDVTKSDRRGRTPLHFAVMSGHPEIARYLLENGAKVNSRDEEGQTPLHIAYALKKDDLVNLLLENGADRTIQDAYGRVPGNLTPVSRKEVLARRKQARKEERAGKGKRKVRFR